MPFADDSGECWPSASTVARLARCNLRNAKKTIATLVAAGERIPVSRKTRGGVEAEKALEPGDPATVGKILVKLAFHYRAPDDDDICAEVYADYLADLAGYSAAVVAEAAGQWRRAQRWWPKLCEILEIAADVEEREQARLTRLRFLLWCSDRFGGQVPRYARSTVPSPAALAAMMAGEAWAARLFQLPESQ